MSTLQKEVNDKTGDIRITWIPLSVGVNTTDACEGFHDALIDDALAERRNVNVVTRGDSTVFHFCLPKIWRDNLADAEALIDEHAAKWLTV